MAPFRASRSSFPFASDQRLAKRAAGGDPEAFATIFGRYQGDLYRFCVAILREPQDAEDAVQNTMVRAMGALPGEQRDIQLRPWLYRIAHNEAVELRRRTRTVEPLRPSVEEVVPGAEERAEQGARLRTLLADIAELPERQRSTLVMRELNGLDFGEIGAALDTSPGAARQALYEARRGLVQMESGRDMACGAAMRQVSDADGRPRGRGVRAHLRDCAPCRHFQTEMHERRRTLASIPPLPALAVTGMLKVVLGGSSAGTSGLVKVGAGLLAVLAIGGAAADHGGLLPGGRGPAPRIVSHREAPRADRPAPEPLPSGGHPEDPSPTAGAAPAGARATLDRGRFKTTAVRIAGPAPANQEGAKQAPIRSAGPEPTTAEPTYGTGAQGARSAAPPRIAGAAGEGGIEGSEDPRGPVSAEEATASDPVGGPEHPVHPEHPEHPEHPVHPEHPEHPVHPEHAEHPVHPEHPEHPVTGGDSPSSPGEGADIAAVTEPSSTEEVVTSSELAEAASTSPPPPAAEPAAVSPNGKAKGHEKQAAAE